MHLGIAALSAALVGMLFEAFVLAARSPLSGRMQLVAVAGSGLLAFGSLAIASSAAAAAMGRLVGGDRAARLAGRPLLLCGELWRGTRAGIDATETGPGAMWAWLAGKAAALAVLTGSIYLAMSRFHEPIRTAVVAACIGIPASFLADRCLRGLVSAVASRLPAPAGQGAQTTLRRASCGLLAALLAAPVVWAVTARERLFGAVDPSPALALALAAAVASAVSSLVFARRSRGGLGRLARPWRVAVAGIAALVGGVLLLSTSGPARQAVGTGGALGREVLSALQAALDMDGDRSAWLLGGDCHPFDGRAHPLATERP